MQWDDVSDSRVQWHLRVRNTDGGAQWGVVGPIRPVDWQITRSKGQPATASVTLGPWTHDDDVWLALADMAEGSQKTYGLSCWHEDRPEPDHDAVFFGPIATVDYPSDGAITISAKDMSHLMAGYSIGHVAEHDAHRPIELFTKIVEDFARKYGQANGIQFLAHGFPDGLPTLAFKCEEGDGKLLSDVVRDYLSAHPDLELIHGKSIDLMLVRPKQYADNRIWTVAKPLVGTGITRQIGVGAEATVTHLIMDRGDDKREITTTRTPPVTGQGDAAMWVRVGADVSAAEAAQIATATAQPDLSATIVSAHQHGVPYPIPGQETFCPIPLPLAGDGTDTRWTIYFRGTISRVTIDPKKVTVEADQHPVT